MGCKEPWRVRVINGDCVECGAPYEYKIPKGFAPPTRCETCVERINAKKEADARATLARQLLDVSGIPARYTVYNQAVSNELNDGALFPWVSERTNESLWIGGPNGIGKTHTACFAAVKAIHERAFTCRLVRASEWLRRVAALRTGDRSARIHAKSLVETAARCSLLILDDVGKERLTETRAECLFDLIDQRERDDRRVWITTNFSGALLLRRMNDAGEHGYGDAIIARLRRMIKPENIWKGGE